MITHSIKEAIRLAGGLSLLARELGTTPQTVSNWRSRGAVPPAYALAIEQSTRGAVRAEDVCPQIPWHLIRGKAA